MFRLIGRSFLRPSGSFDSNAPSALHPHFPNMVEGAKTLLATYQKREQVYIRVEKALADNARNIFAAELSLKEAKTIRSRLVQEGNEVTVINAHIPSGKPYVRALEHHTRATVPWAST